MSYSWIEDQNPRLSLAHTLFLNVKQYKFSVPVNMLFTVKLLFSLIYGSKHIACIFCVIHV